MRRRICGSRSKPRPHFTHATDCVLRRSPGWSSPAGEVDAIAGLLTLRERQPFTLYATQRILAVLDANPVFEVLARDVVPAPCRWRWRNRWRCPAA